MAQKARSRTPPIAVVGVGALFPGSKDERGFWRDILAGRDLISDVPADRWLIEDFYDPDPAAPDKTYAKRGGFLEHVDFRPLDFGMPPNAVPATDTAQLLALMVAQTALKDAAQGDISKLDRERCSVILGVTSAQELMVQMAARLQRPIWIKALRETGIPEDEAQAACDRMAASYVPWQESTFPGLLGNVVAGRIANRFDLRGTNSITDAACASSLSAFSVGIDELALGRADLVLAGGVDTYNDVSMYLCFSKTPALSPSGDCRPFDESADGTLLGEGLGMVVLKRLEDAERDGDPIYAVIRGIGSASDGRALSVYAPLPEGQARALRRCYEDAGYGPEDVELIEAHGTGTKAGDAAEFAALRQVFSEAGSGSWCALGSVKSQVGHTKAAAGAAGMFKVVMALHNKVLPPTIKVSKPNPKLEIEKSPFYLNTEARPWIKDAKKPRRAALSSFGFGGSNFHVTVEEYQGKNPSALRHRTLPAELVLLSAPSAAPLVALCREAAASSDSLEAIARRSQAAFQSQDAARLSVVAADTASLKDVLGKAAAAIERKPAEPITSPLFCYEPLAAQGSVAFLFPGQGSQYVGMGADLAMSFDAAREVWDAAAAVPLEEAARLQDVVFPQPAFDDSERARQATELARTEWAQPAIGVVSAALLALLRAVGVKPDAVGGHSFGEISALFAAGALRFEDLLRVARRRGELMAEAALGTPGAMTAVSGAAAEIETVVAGIDVVVANHNSPKQAVLSGLLAAIEAAEAKLAEAGRAFRRLPVASAFHSPVVAASSAPFRELLERIGFQPAQCAVYSNAEATAYPEELSRIRDLLAAQIAKPVRFAQMIEAMYARGVRTFVEVGPGSVLSGLVEQCLEGRPFRAIVFDRKGQHGVVGFWQGLGRLALAGVAMDFATVWTGFRAEAEAVAPGSFALSINGGNYGRPYPPKGGAAALPKPNPPRPLISSPMHEIDKNAPPSPTPSLPQPTPVATPTPLAAAPAAGDALLAYEAYQKALSDGHQKYLHAMETTLGEGHKQYLRSMESSFVSLCAALTGQALPEGASVPLAALPPTVAMPAPPVLRDVMTPPVPAPAAVPEPVPVPQPRAAVPAPIARAAPAASGVDRAALLLEVVADKTGYPQEMLNLDMGLEADLGIDSIKRVEILAAMQERLPDVGKIEPSEVAELRTLRHVVDRLTRDVTAPRVEAPVAIAAAAAALDRAALLLEVVADKTGYPKEMLNLEMALEADLGIDSIKRVEILAAMQEQLPDVGKIEPSEVAELRTLRHVVDRLTRETPVAAVEVPAPAAIAAPVAMPAAPVLPASNPPMPSDRPVSVQRQVLRATTCEERGESLRPKLGDRVVVTPDGRGVAEALVALLQKRGVKAETLAQVPGDATAVLFLGGLREVDAESAVAVSREAFAAAQAVAGRFSREGGVFVTVQDTGGDFGLSGAGGARAWLGALSGLAKTAAIEWPAAIVRSIDIERGSRQAETVAAALLMELESGGARREIGLTRDGRRLSLDLATETAAGGALPVDAESVIVATGGGRGVTAAALIALARAAQPRFLILGRSPLEDEPTNVRGLDAGVLRKALLERAKTAGQQPTPAELARVAARIEAGREVAATLAALEAAGSKALYVALDVRDTAALDAAIEKSRAAFGPITGIVHGAGTLADKKIADKSAQAFADVFDTKVLGLRNLLAATAADPLRLVAFFSSIAAREGNAGQCDYAMANEALNKVAASVARNRPECVVRSLNWGPLDGGMVDASLKAHFESRGVPLIPLEQGAAAFLDEIRCPSGDVEIVLLASHAPAKPVQLGVGAGDAIESLTLNPSVYPWLIDHSIDGVPVVPAVLVLEWFCRAAQQRSPGLEIIGCDDLRVLKGVPLHGYRNGGDHLVIHGRPEPGRPGEWAMELRGKDGTRHYVARVRLASALHSNGAGPSLPPLQPSPWTAAELYQGLLFHGPALQVIHSIQGVSKSGIVGMLSGTADVDLHGGPWRIDVAALDGGLQLARAWGAHLTGRVSLPTRIGSLRVYGRGPVAGPLRCVLHGTVVGDHRTVSDMHLETEDGKPYAELREVEMHFFAEPRTTA